MSVAELTQSHPTTEGLHYRDVILEAERLLHPMRRTTAEIHTNGLYPYERHPGYVEQRAQQLLTDMSVTSLPVPTADAKQLQQDAQEIDALREDLYKVRPHAKEAAGQRTYDIVLDVWRMQKLMTEIQALSSDEKEKKQRLFRKYLRLQLMTHLRENCNVYDHTTTYSFRGGHMYMDTLSQTEAFDVIAARGVVISENDGSVDTVREHQELRGVVHMGEVGRFAPVGTRYMLLSGNGLSEDTRYGHFFVDIGEVQKDRNGKQMLVVTRFKTDADHKNAILAAQAVDPEYLAEYDSTQMAIDAYEVGKLALFSQTASGDQEVTPVHDVYEQLFGHNPDAMRESTFLSEVWRIAEQYAQRYADAVIRQASWEELADAYEDMVVAQQDAVDQLKQHMGGRRFADLATQSAGHIVTHRGDVYYRQQEIKSGGSGCGKVKSLGRKGLATMATGAITQQEFLQNSVASQGLDAINEEGLESFLDEEDEHGSLYFDCPFGEDNVQDDGLGICGRQNKRVPGSLQDNCTYCTRKLPRCA